MMQRIFFHNPFDKYSIEQLENLPEEVQVYNVMDHSILLPEIPIRAVPYLIDRQISLLTEPPYKTGGFILQFKCQDWQDNDLTEEPAFWVTINGITHSQQAAAGVLEIEINYADPISLSIELIAEGYLPWRGGISVVSA